MKNNRSSHESMGFSHNRSNKEKRHYTKLFSKTVTQQRDIGLVHKACQPITITFIYCIKRLHSLIYIVNDQSDISIMLTKISHILFTYEG